MLGEKPPFAEGLRAVDMEGALWNPVLCRLSPEGSGTESTLTSQRSVI